MPKGRKPQGVQPLTGAERQARYRARHARAPVVRYRRPADRRTRHQRWCDAVAELVALQSEYAQWFEALPDPFRDTATGDALQAILDLDLDEISAIEPRAASGKISRTMPSRTNSAITARPRGVHRPLPRTAPPDSPGSLRDARALPWTSGTTRSRPNYSVNLGVHFLMSQRVALPR